MVFLFKNNSMLITTPVNLNQEQNIIHVLILYLSCIFYCTKLHAFGKTNEKQLTDLMHHKETSTLITSDSTFHSPFVDLNHERVIKQVSTDNLPFLSGGAWLNLFKIQHVKQHANLRHLGDIEASNLLNISDTKNIGGHSTTKLRISDFKLMKTEEKVILVIIKTQQVNTCIIQANSTKFNHLNLNTTTSSVYLANILIQTKPKYYKHHR